MRIGWSTRYHGLTSHMWRMPRWGPQRPRVHNWVQLGVENFFLLMTYLILGFQGPKKSAEGNRLGYIQWFEWLDVVCHYHLCRKQWHLVHTLWQQMTLKRPRDWFFIQCFGASRSPKILEVSSPFRWKLYERNFARFSRPQVCHVLCGLILWRWCSSTGGSLISPSIRCLSLMWNGHRWVVLVWKERLKIGKHETDWMRM